MNSSTNEESIMGNKQENEKRREKERILHDKVGHNKSSTAGLKQLHCKPPFHCNPRLLNVKAPCGYAYIQYHQLLHDD